jgi:hypothetical protein
VALLAAVLVGGVSQAFVHRTALGSVASVTDSQFLWALLVFGVAWACAEGRIGPGMVAGGLTGLALIASYYIVQWLAEGRHAAVSQFSDARGVAWTIAAVAGGVIMGLFGGLAGVDARRRPRTKALGMTTPGVVVGLGPLVWVLVDHDRLGVTGVLAAVLVFALVGTALFVAAIRMCGPAASLQAAAISIAIGALAVTALLVLETSGWLYLTF